MTSGTFRRRHSRCLSEASDRVPSPASPPHPWAWPGGSGEQTTRHVQTHRSAAQKAALKPKTSEFLMDI